MYFCTYISIITVYRLQFRYPLDIQCLIYCLFMYSIFNFRFCFVFVFFVVKNECIIKKLVYAKHSWGGGRWFWIKLVICIGENILRIGELLPFYKNFLLWCKHWYTLKKIVKSNIKIQLNVITWILKMCSFLNGSHNALCLQCPHVSLRNAYK